MCNYTKFQLKIPIFFGHLLKCPRVDHIFDISNIGMIGNETGHLLECVKLYGKLIRKKEKPNTCWGDTLLLLRRKLHGKNLYSAKCDNKSNINVF